MSASLRLSAGHTDAALVHAGFAAPQRSIGGRRGAIDLIVHVAAVVGGEDNQGVLGDSKALDGVENLADVVVEAMNHGGVGGAALRTPQIDARAIVLDKLGLGVKGRVYRELPVIEEKGLVSLRFHEGHRLVPHAVFDVLPWRLGGKVIEFPRGHEAAGRAGARPMRDIDVEAMLQRAVGIRAQVPLAEVGRGVAGLLECFGEGKVGRIEASGALALARWAEVGLEV
jgi:hypothetical protein